MAAPRLLSVVAALFVARAALAGEVKTLSEDWEDAARKRRVPVKIYYPAELTQPTPVIIFSHGLGGSRDNYVYLGTAWASAGYVSVHLQHIGSDDSLWRGTRREGGNVRDKLQAGISPQSYKDRIEDVKFALDELARKNADAAWRLGGRLDLKHVAMAGHSFGAQTTQAIAGQLIVVGEQEFALADDRITCAIAMSPAPPTAPAKVVDRAYTKMRVPVLWMTGTNDTGAIRESDPTDRLVPYEKTTAKDQYQIVFKDGDHMAFGGRGPMQKLSPTIAATATAFLDAYLRVDAQKQKALPDTLRELVTDTATVQSK